MARFVVIFRDQQGNPAGSGTINCDGERAALAAARGMTSIGTNAEVWDIARPVGRVAGAAAEAAISLGRSMPGLA